MPLRCCIDDVRHRNVLPLDRPLREEPVIGGANSSVTGKQKKPGGLSIESMHRRESGQPRAPLQADQQRAFEVLSSGRDRHAVWLIHYKNVLIPVNDKSLLARFWL